MKFTPTDVDGCYIVDLEPFSDDRGMFARTFDVSQFEAVGLPTHFVQSNLSTNRVAGTLRGLHRQIPPYAEDKLVTCVKGAIVDVCVDLREESDSFGKHVMVELNDTTGRALFVPAYCGHGYQTLVDDTRVTYQVSGPYAPEGERGQRFDDPAFGIEWPLPVASISQKDATWPDWEGRPIR